jgi:hypothetical protein
MPLYANSRADLIKFMLKVPLRNYVGGVVDSGTTTTVVDNSLEQPDDYFQNTTPVSRVRILSTTDGQAPKGEERRITDYAHSTGTITVSTDKPFSAAPGAGDTFIVLDEYDWEELAAAINLVIAGLTEKCLIYKVDETLETQSDTYELALPSGFVTVHRVSMANSDGDFLEPIPPDQYRIHKENPAKIKFLTMPTDQQHVDHYYGDSWFNSGLEADRVLRIEGYTKQGELETDDAICYLNPNYIVYKAAALVLGSRITAQDFDAYQARRDECEKQAEAFAKELVVTQFPPDTKWVSR